MDYRYLVESGEYNKEELKPMDKAFILGMEYVMNEVISSQKQRVEDYYEIDLDNKTSVLDKMLYEIEISALDDLKEYIYISICEAIVSDLDSYEVDD